MMDRPYLSVIIPAYNEARRLPGTLERVTVYLARQPYRAEVLVVDDGSTDGTADAATVFAGGTTPVRAISTPHRGKGHAVKTGMLAAAGEYRFLCDADLSMPIEQLERLLPPAAGTPIVIGSREAPGARRCNEPWTRHIMGRVFNWFIRATTVRGIRDTQCGFKCFRGAVAQELFAQQRLDGFGFDVEVLFLAQKSGIAITETPIDWYHQQESKVRPLRDALRMVRETLAVRWCWMRGRYRRVTAR
ncbi:MAG: glycosyltransferase family 2 protein [Dehalococcoidia bacterium]|nr:glycosyltransferase family 2 protein [Dehalococcoidia bacterium]